MLALGWEKSRQAITLPAEVTAENRSSIDHIVRENALKIYQLIRCNLRVIKTIQAKYRNTCHYFYDAALPEAEIINAWIRSLIQYLVSSRNSTGVTPTFCDIILVALGVFPQLYSFLWKLIPGETRGSPLKWRRACALGFYLNSSADRLCDLEKFYDLIVPVFSFIN